MASVIGHIGEGVLHQRHQLAHFMAQQLPGRPPLTQFHLIEQGHQIGAMRGGQAGAGRAKPGRAVCAVAGYLESGPLSREAGTIPAPR